MRKIVDRTSKRSHTLLIDHLTVNVSNVFNTQYQEPSLKFNRLMPDDNYIVKSYQPGQFILRCLETDNLDASTTPGQATGKDLTIDKSIILSPGKLIDHWVPQSFAELTLDHLHQLNSLQPELILLGTGPQLQFPAQAWMLEFLQAGIGFEVMDTRAACRTYNFLCSEGRLPVAALLAH